MAGLDATRRPLSGLAVLLRRADASRAALAIGAARARRGRRLGAFARLIADAGLAGLLFSHWKLLRVWLVTTRF